MNTIALKTIQRTGLGKSETKKVRREGQVPAVLHLGSEALHFSIAAQDLHPILHTAQTYVIDLEVAGKTHKAIISEAQFHPVFDNPLHVDFVSISLDKPILAELPIKLTGSAEGVLKGGKLIQKVRKLRVKGAYDKLPAIITLDVTHVGLGKSLKVADIKLEGFSVEMAPDVAIATVEITRALRQENPGAQAAAAAASKAATPAKK